MAVAERIWRRKEEKGRREGKKKERRKMSSLLPWLPNRGGGKRGGRGKTEMKRGRKCHLLAVAGDEWGKEKN